MDLLDSLQTLAARARQQAGHFQTEEAVKTALVLPFLRALGYDVFDPEQVTSGPLGSVGLPHRQRVDLILRAQGTPLLLLECLPFGQPFGDPATTNLYWTFPAAGVRLGVLTNGTCYRFYADLEHPGILDDQPYFEFDVLAYRERDLEELKRYARGVLEVDALLASAAEAKVARRVVRVLADQMAQPSPAFLQALADLSQAGPLTGEAQLDAFGRLVRRGFQQVVADRIHDRLLASRVLDEDPEAGSDRPFIQTQRLEPLPEHPEAEVVAPAAPFEGIAHIAWAAPEPPPLAAGPLSPPEVPIAEAAPAIPMPALIQEEAPAPRTRAWTLALAVALVGTAGLAWTRLHHPEPPTAPFQIQVETAPASEPRAAGTPDPAPAAPLVAAVARGSLEEAVRLSEGRATALAPDHWTLRLAIAHEPPTVRNLLAALKGQEDAVFLRPIQMRDGRGCYQVFLGDFQDEATARQAATQLPTGVLEGGKAPKLFKAGTIPARQD